MESSAALHVVQQKDIYQKLQNHFNVIFNAPCKYFPGYPFTWKDGECDVSITAIIEHFGEEQQDALTTSCNKMLAKKGGHLNTGPDYVISSLKASKLQRVEGGIQFESNPSKSFTKWTAERLMEEIKIGECAYFWTHIDTYSDFVNHCQIRFNVENFGGTDVKKVEFHAYAGLPIFLMLWLLRQLDFEIESDKCGFGKVIIVDRNGLPSDEHCHALHFSSGLIKWE